MKTGIGQSEKFNSSLFTLFDQSLQLSFWQKFIVYNLLGCFEISDAHALDQTTIARDQKIKKLINSSEFTGDNILYKNF